MITERTLRKWRKEALKIKEFEDVSEPIRNLQHFADYVLRMTQVLLDQHLIRKETG